MGDLLQSDDCVHRFCNHLPDKRKKSCIASIPRSARLENYNNTESQPSTLNVFAGRKEQSNLGPTSVWVLLSGCSQPSPREPRSRPGGGLQVGPRDEEAFGRLPDRHEAPAPLPRAARVGRQRILPRQVHGADPAEPAETRGIGRRRRRFGRRTRHMRHMHPFFLRGHDSKTTDCDSKTTDCAVPTRFKCCVNHVPI